MASSSLPDVGDKPSQPDRHCFPKRSFGKSKVVHRAFQASWFVKWPWLHYYCSQDVVYCHTCVTAVKSEKLKITGNLKESTFIYGGFHNWKDACRIFSNHESSVTHKNAVDVVITLPRTSGDVGEMLSSTLAVQKRINRQYLMKVAECVRFLARQGIPFRGDGKEEDGNFTQLVYLHGAEDPQFRSRLQQKRDRYMSPQIQNELIKVMSINVLRKIVVSIQEAKYFSLMADEVTDISNKEQVVVCLRSVNETLEPYENFVGIYCVDSIEADNLVATLKDTLLRMNLPIGNCRGQCYDGASNMCGIRKGVATQIRSEEPRSIFIHCYGHALNLAAGDTVKSNRTLRDTLDTTFEMSKLIKFSPRRDAIFNKLKAEMAPDVPGFRTLCPTRWTVKASSLESVVKNYAVLQALWEEAREIVKDSETRARIIGVQSMMMQFDYLFGLVLGERILKHTDNLSKTLQNPALTASEGQQIAELTCQTLGKMRTSESFDLFWRNLTALQEEKEVNEPVLPRRRKTRYEIGSGTGHYADTPEDYYRRQYFECLDLIVNCIRTRFDQPGYHTLKNLEDSLLKALKNEDYSNELDFVISFYKDDISPSSLKTQLELLSTSFSESDYQPSITGLRDYIRSLSPPVRTNLSEVCTLLKIVMVIPATNAVSERSASAVRRIKTYLRSTMTQVRFNNLLILHIHKEKTDNLDLASCLNEFIAGNEHRLSLFGEY